MAEEIHESCASSLQIRSAWMNILIIWFFQNTSQRYTDTSLVFSLCVCVCVCVCVCSLSRVQLFAILWTSLPGSSVHGIFQARILEWIAISCSRGSSRPRDQTHILCFGRRILCHCATLEHTFLAMTLQILAFLFFCSLDRQRIF